MFLDVRDFTRFSESTKALLRSAPPLAERPGIALKGKT